MRRLEAATSRLEDIASSAFDGELPPKTDTNGAATNGVPATSIDGALLGRTSQEATPVPSIAQEPVKEELPASVEDFDTLLNGDLKSYHELSKSGTLDKLLGEQADSVVKAFEAQRTFLLVATKAKKPDMAGAAYMDTLKDLQAHMTKVDDIRQSSRASAVKDHLALIADSVGTLAWVTIETKPADYVSELFGGAQMYGNKVLKQFKETDESQVEWVKSFYKVMRSLVAYVKEHHPKGVQWNPQGVDAAQALKDIKSGASAAPTSSIPPPPGPAPSGAIPPPPGPPPPPGSLPPIPTANKSKPTDMGSVFAELSKGEGVTSGLKKVDPSQMTHKNPSLRSSSQVPERSDSSGSVGGRGVSPAPPGKKPKPEAFRTKKPPKKELDGNKWIIVRIAPISAVQTNNQLTSNLGKLREHERATRNPRRNQPLHPHHQVQKHHPPHPRQSKRHLHRQLHQVLTRPRFPRLLRGRHQMSLFRYSDPGEGTYNPIGSGGWSEYLPQQGEFGH